MKRFSYIKIGTITIPLFVQFEIFWRGGITVHQLYSRTIKGDYNGAKLVLKKGVEILGKTTSPYNKAVDGYIDTYTVKLESDSFFAYAEISEWDCGKIA